MKGPRIFQENGIYSDQYLDWNNFINMSVEKAKNLIEIRLEIFKECSLQKENVSLRTI